MDAETKGERAKQILENEVYQGAVEDAKRGLKDKWGMEPSAEARENLWHRLQAIDTVTEQLKIYHGTGAVERMKRERKGKTDG